MATTRFQYFLAFAVLGSLLPFLPLFLSDRGMNQQQVGYALGLSSIAAVFTPVLITFVADWRIAGRWLIAALFVCGGALLGAMTGVYSFTALTVLLSLYFITASPMISLQDGLYFSAQAKAADRGERGVPYHRVRVWGTVGFVVPGLVIFFLLRAGFSTAWTLVAAAVCCALGAINAPFLPDTAVPASARAAVPTVQAARVLWRPNTLVFCIAMLMAHLVGAAYYGFFPLYLREIVHLDDKWIGLISSLGVVLEIFYMLAFGRLAAKLGLRKLLALGLAAMALRMALIAMWPFAAVMVGVQLLHGMWVLVIHVAPPVFLNQAAESGYRNSVQGLYAMLIVGGGRVLGSILSGHLAQASLVNLFWAAAGLSIIASSVFLLVFRDTVPITGQGEAILPTSSEAP